MRCLDDAELQALMDGALEGERLAYADAHIDECASCRSVVLALARAERGEDPTEAGATIGRYVVLEPIGSGAMGVVLAAYDRELDRKIALKLLRADALADPETARERMRREAQAMAKLSHPNVVHVYEVGTSDARVFVAMELVAGGRTLRAWWNERSRSATEILSIFVQAGRGLAAAHDAGLVHRDFKPENVVVGPDERARVTDFGLARGSMADARAIDPREPIATSITQTGTLIGTPAYMAPEQLEGLHADAKSDQFAFCVALYEGIFGARPFAGRTLADLRESVAKGASIPSRRGVPSHVARALARGLAVDPKERFDDMRALLEALEPRASRPLAWIAIALLASIATVVTAFAVRTDAPCEGADAVLAGTWNDARRAAVRRALGGAEYGSRSAQLVIEALDAWARRWIGDHERICRATRIDGTQSEALLDARMACLASARRHVDALARRLASADPSASAQAATVIEALPDLDACRTVELPSTPPPRNARARIDAIERRVADAQASVALAQIGRARAASERAAIEADELGWGPSIADAQLARAHALRAAGALAEAERAAYASLFAAEESGDDHRAATAWIALVGIAGARGDDERAALLGRHARAVLARIGRPRRLAAALANDLGAVLTRLGRYDDAARSLDRALAASVREHGERSLEVARVRTNLGNLARARGDLDAALEQHLAALAIDRRALGEDHPAVARHHHNVAGILRVLGRREDALRHYERALAIKRAALGDDHLDVALTENSLGLLESELGHAARARDHYRHALAIFARAHHSDEALVATNLAILEAARGDHDAALASFERAIERLGDAGAREAIVRASLGAAESARAAGRPDDARRYADRALRSATPEVDASLAEAARTLVEELRAPPPPRPRRTAVSNAAQSSVVAPAYLPGPAWDGP